MVRVVVKYFPILDAIKAAIWGGAAIFVVYVVANIVENVKNIPEKLKEPFRKAKEKINQLKKWSQKNPLKALLAIIVGAFVGAGLITAAAAAGVSIGVASFVLVPTIGFIAGVSATAGAMGAFHKCVPGERINPQTGKAELFGCVGEAEK